MLFDEAGSGVDDDARAVLVRDPTASAVNEPGSVTTAEAPTARVDQLHDRPDKSHAPPAVAEIPVAAKSAGTLSTSVTLRATEGPAFVTVMV